MAEKKYTVIFNLTDLEMVAQALQEVRMPCSEPDCFNCSNYAEIERRVRQALAAHNR